MIGYHGWLSLQCIGWIDGVATTAASGGGGDEGMTAFGIGQIIGFLVLALLVAGVVSELVKRRRGDVEES